MSTITLPNIRVSSDLTVKVRLKDSGVAIDWSTLTKIKASIYSDAQRALAGRCDVSIDEEDSTLLVCTYAANKPQYLGVNRIVISAKYMGETKTYDKPAFSFVRWTADQEGEEITIDDPDVDVEIDVEDISSSILQEAVDAAFEAADRANDAAAAAEHMVDIHTGPEGKSAYEVAVEEGYTGTEEEWLASLVGPQGQQGIQGETGEAAGFGTVSVSLQEDGGQPSATVAASGTDTAKNFAFTFNNLKGEKGDKGDQGNSGYTGAAGELEVVNNLTDGGAAKALSAEMGKTLEGEVSQLEAEVNGLSNEEKEKTGGTIVIDEQISFATSDNTYHISLPRGATIKAKLIADGVTPSAGIIVKAYYVDGANNTFSPNLSAIGMESTLIAAKEVSYIYFYNNDASTTATVEISCSYGVEGTLNTNKIDGGRIDFIEQDAQYNLFDKDKASLDAFVNGNTGIIQTNVGTVASPFIPVIPGKKYYINGQVLARYYAFFTDEKVYISGDNTTSGFITELTVPANAKFVRFTCVSGSYQSLIFSLNPLSGVENRYTTNEKIVLPIEEKSIDLKDVEVVNAGNIIDRNALIVGAYINATTGELTTTPQTEWVATDWCEIDPTKQYRWYKISNFYAAFYDEAKRFLIGYSTSNRLPNPVTPPVNAKFARFTMNDSTVSAFGKHPSDVCWVAADSENRTPNDYKSYSFPKEIYTEREIGVNPCDYTGREISLFNKILCVGDSLMFGNENVASGSPSIIAKEPLFNIPAYIKKMSGVDTTNAAHSGYTAEQWLADFGTQDLSGHDAVIIQIGVNNWLSWVSASDAAIDTFKTTLGQIIDYVISQNAYNNGGTLKNKPKVFVATQFPAMSYLKNTHGVSVDVLNKAIRDVVASRTDCYLLDMAVYSHSNDNIAFNRGHLTSLGYRQVAQDYCGIISKFINDNLNLFVDTAFVGTPATQFTYSETEW